MKVLVGSRSAGKQHEIRALLEGSGLEVVFPPDLMMPESAEEAGLELGDTFEANARAKALHFSRKSFLPTLADDSGLEVVSLGGAPGVRSRRWSGVTGTELDVDRANNALLLRRLLGAPPEKRRARYRCVLAWIPAHGAVTQTFEGVCNGTILAEPRGHHGFGYDPLFHSDDLDRTFAEVTPDEKHGVSHRARAFEAFLGALRASR